MTSDRYTAVVTEMNRRATSTRVTSIAAASIAVIVDDYMESKRIVRLEWSTYSPYFISSETLWDTFGVLRRHIYPSPATLKDSQTAVE
ncbi:hypothetical protein NPIL_79131 [Nephila pilipes]|uniref:Uncharacterized protein n=1 Tax=Nephila pilipes TaxID=299642 RepID=A0A8X6PVC6_NEPPI|nr:hypothetical protein NPIL_79131 [Nephila pilipes]